MSDAEPPILSDGVVALRAWQTGDARFVFEACQDPLIARFMPIPQPYTQADADAFVALRARDWETDDERSFAIVDAVNGVGLGAIARHGRPGHRYEFGYWLAPPARGRGLAARSLNLIVEWTLATTSAVRLEVGTEPANGPSARVAERAGFELEGTRRAWILDRGGRPVDLVYYVRIRDAAGERR